MLMSSIRRYCSSIALAAASSSPLDLAASSSPLRPRRRFALVGDVRPGRHRRSCVIAHRHALLLLAFRHQFFSFYFNDLVSISCQNSVLPEKIFLQIFVVELLFTFTRNFILHSIVSYFNAGSTSLLLLVFSCSFPRLLSQSTSSLLQVNASFLIALLSLLFPHGKMGAV
jgi:hypothetical protein